MTSVLLLESLLSYNIDVAQHPGFSHFGPDKQQLLWCVLITSVNQWNTLAPALRLVSLFPPFSLSLLRVFTPCTTYLEIFTTAIKGKMLPKLPFISEQSSKKVFRHRSLTQSNIVPNGIEAVSLSLISDIILRSALNDPLISLVYRVLCSFLQLDWQWTTLISRKRNHSYMCDEIFVRPISAGEDRFPFSCVPVFQSV